MNNLKSFLILIVFVLVLPLNAQDKKKVAVFDPAGSVPNSTKEIVREEISSILVNSQSYSVLERSMIDKVLEENKFQMSGLVDDSQISDMGKMMGANLVLATSITMMDNGGYFLSLKMINVQTANIEKQKTARSASDDLLDVIGITVKEMFAVSGNSLAVSQQSPKTSSITGSKSRNSELTDCEKLEKRAKQTKRKGIILTASTFGVAWLVGSGALIAEGNAYQRLADMKKCDLTDNDVRTYVKGCRSFGAGVGMFFWMPPLSAPFVIKGIKLRKQSGIDGIDQNYQDSENLQ